MGRLLEARAVLIALAAIFAVSVAAMMGLQINRAYHEAVEQGFRDVRNLANTLAQHTHQSVLGVDLVLQGLTAPELVPVLLDPQRQTQAYGILRSRARILPGVLGLMVLTADGRIFNSSNDLPHIDMSARPEFLALRDGADVVLSPPTMGKGGTSKDRPVIVMSRRIESPDGKFLGTVEASISIDYFLEFYGNLDIGSRGVIGVVRKDGVAVIRYPFQESLYGRPQNTSPIYQAYKKTAGQGELLSTYVSDGIDRLTAYRDVADIDVFVSVGLAVDDVLAGWRRSASIEGAAGAALILLMASLVYMANRFLTAREAARQNVTARLNQLAASSADIAAIHTGAGLVDGMRRMVQELIPGGQADVRFGTARVGVGHDVAAAPQQITVPLQTKGGRVLGTLHVARPDGPPLTDQDVAVLMQLATIGTVALENVELLADSQRLTAQAERARAEEAEARRRIEDVFATMSEGVYTLDRKGRFTFLNDNAVMMLLRPREELQGRVWWEVYPHMRESELRAVFTQVVEKQASAEYVLEYETHEGTQWMDVRVFPTKDGCSVYIRDITQRIDTESKLRQAQKMEAIGQLTGGIAHDFNNLLTVVLGNIDMLVESLHTNPRMKHVAEVARDAALRGATLVARLLAFARRQALAPRAVDVNALTRNLEDLLRRTIGEAVTVIMKRAPDLWQANIDPTQMENALLNLALNARDAMPAGGALTIATSNAHLDPDAGEDAPPPGDYVLVEVRDTGTGMSEDVRSRAFDPFFTTKPVGQGSGLGLSMVYGFVRQSGGHVRIESDVGKGTAIRMYLPRAGAAETLAPAPAVATPTPAGHETVLLVEDDELVREHLSVTLQALGYAIIPCATGREAIDIVSGGAQADVLLTDVVLGGGMNGHSVAEKIKELRPDMPVLYMSGYTEDAIIHEGRLDPGIHFISKPFRRQEIARKLRDVLSTHR